ncbi:hypothetical protein M569_17267 [Genlisea aurea]|uniref:Uncharacterized protein n=1 Tax=Genlisea aurea TaxID=192259 RepID=S8BSI8_9LAMI|nr:hypothetical protein M569_17267 [Genlisea aurea]
MNRISLTFDSCPSCHSLAGLCEGKSGPAVSPPTKFTHAFVTEPGERLKRRPDFVDPGISLATQFATDPLLRAAGNDIGAEGAKALAEALKANNSVHTIHLNGMHRLWSPVMILVRNVAPPTPVSSARVFFWVCICLVRGAMGGVIGVSFGLEEYAFCLPHVFPVFQHPCVSLALWFER